MPPGEQGNILNNLLYCVNIVEANQDEKSKGDFSFGQKLQVFQVFDLIIFLISAGLKSKESV